MSIILNGEFTSPRGLEIKTHGDITPNLARTVFLGRYEIDLRDFLTAARYVLTNTDLSPQDPRRDFVNEVRSLQETDGWNKGRQRFAL